jgi:EspA/EspE family
MSVLADAARMLLNIANLGDNFAGGSNPADFSGEYWAANVTSMSGDLANIITGGSKYPLAFRRGYKFVDGGSTFKEKFNFGLGTAKKAGKDWSSPILWTISVVEMLEMTLGFDPPDEGDDLEVGSERFTVLCEQLKAALPDDAWQGGASQAYAELDTALQDLAQTLTELDLQFADLVRNQAEWVTHGRLSLGILKHLLTAAHLIQIAITLAPPPGGPIPAQAFAIKAALLGVTTGVAIVSTVSIFAGQKISKAAALEAKYDEAAAAASVVSPGALVRTTTTSPAGSTVSSFESISGSMSGASATMGASGFAGAVSGSAHQRAVLDAASGESIPEGIAAIAAIPGAASASISTVPMPTLAQVAAMSGQVGTLSGYASQPANLVNQAIGQIQQVAPMGKQGQGVGAAAEEAAPQEAAHADEAEADGAGAGTKTAARAPLDTPHAAAADAEQEQIPAALGAASKGR